MVFPSDLGLIVVLQVCLHNIGFSAFPHKRRGQINSRLNPGTRTHTHSCRGQRVPSPLAPPSPYVERRRVWRPVRLLGLWCALPLPRRLLCPLCSSSGRKEGGRRRRNSHSQIWRRCQKSKQAIFPQQSCEGREDRRREERDVRGGLDRRVSRDAGDVQLSAAARAGGTNDI